MKAYYIMQYEIKSIRRACESLNTVSLCTYVTYCNPGTYELCLNFSQQREATFFINLTKVNLVASYTVSTNKNGEFEVDIVYYFKKFFKISSVCFFFLTSGNLFPLPSFRSLLKI